MTPQLSWWLQMLRDRRPCTCTMGPGRCGPDGCDCTTSIMECKQHGGTDIGRAEAEIVRRQR